MDENNRPELLTDNFPSNSRKEKTKKPVKNLPDERKLEKVVTGTVKRKKRSFGKKVAETFLEDDTKNVGSYILYDVLIPAAKSMISEMVGGGIEMLLFGERKSSRTYRENGRSYFNYGGVSSSLVRDQNTKRSRDISRTGRSRHEFDEIILDTRGEAEEVLSQLVDLTIDYGMATVADLYELCDISSDYTDAKHGWTDLRNSSVSRVSGGYLINLPRTQSLE